MLKIGPHLIAFITISKNPISLIRNWHIKKSSFEAVLRRLGLVISSAEAISRPACRQVKNVVCDSAGSRQQIVTYYLPRLSASLA